jgi:triphosphoribosyl-dephospho-CoA synthase
MLSRGESLGRAVRWACAVEIHAMKPGNVSIHSPGHGMSAELFLASAEAIAAPISAPGASVGERILHSVQATRAVAGCNTNLGIVLLAAPLVHAALLAPDAAHLRDTLRQVLAGLTVDDAVQAYEAIRIAEPGGMGERPRHDVRDTPRVTLLAAMQEAAARDSIAREYTNGFAEVMERGKPLAQACLRRWRSAEWTAVAVYLDFLARIPDTLIARKFGAEAAERVRREAAPLAAVLAEAQNPEEFSGLMLEFDSRLKRQGLNPGTSADLTVASLLAARSEEVLQEEVFGRGTGHGPRRQATWDRSRAYSQFTEKET